MHILPFMRFRVWSAKKAADDAYAAYLEAVLDAHGISFERRSWHEQQAQRAAMGEPTEGASPERSASERQ